MKRRWFIRILFMLPILLCVVWWAWGGLNFSFVSYCHGGHRVGCSPSSGVVTVHFGWDGRMPDGWHCRVVPIERDRFWPESRPNFRFYLGFGIGRVADGMMSLDMLSVPYWFLIIGSSVVLLIVWRKTRPKLNPRTAFPVASSKPNEEKVGKSV